MQTPVRSSLFCQILLVFICKLSLIIKTIIIMQRVYRNRWSPYTTN